jgi:hypothetical protein
VTRVRRRVHGLWPNDLKLGFVVRRFPPVKLRAPLFDITLVCRGGSRTMPLALPFAVVLKPGQDRIQWTPSRPPVE